MIAATSTTIVRVRNAVSTNRTTSTAASSTATALARNAANGNTAAAARSIAARSTTTSCGVSAIRKSGTEFDRARDDVFEPTEAPDAQTAQWEVTIENTNPRSRRLSRG